jgi:putative ABC transport system substrate-binding protein
VLGRLSGSAPDTIAAFQKVYEDALAELGYVEGRDIVHERRFANGRVEALAALAEDLVRAKPDVIVAGGNRDVEAARRVTGTIPIVMVAGIDPVGAGFVASLARPGGNVTGLTTTVGNAAYAAKSLELLKELVPNLRRVAYLRMTDESTDRQHAAVAGAAQALGLRLLPVDVSESDGFDRAFATIAAQRADALIMAGGGPLFAAKQRICAFALANRLPAMYVLRDFAEAGLLVSYGLRLSDNFRRAAYYVDRILRGTKPGDLAVEQPALFEMVVNMRTAKAIGVSVPRSVLLRADEVIE